MKKVILFGFRSIFNLLQWSSQEQSCIFLCAIFFSNPTVSLIMFFHSTTDCLKQENYFPRSVYEIPFYTFSHQTSGLFFFLSLKLQSLDSPLFLVFFRLLFMRKPTRDFEGFFLYYLFFSFRGKTAFCVEQRRRYYRTCSFLTLRKMEREKQYGGGRDVMRQGDDAIPGR